MAFNENLEMDSYQKNKNTIESILALKPDARPLYRYRISYSQFLHLQAYLSENHLSFYDVVKVTKFSNGLDKLFVLYAAEWWRREYTGNWGWADLLNSIKIRHGDISNQDLMRITESGLSKWDREISLTALNHRSSMGSFLREGGLPINYFNASGGWLDLLYGAMEEKAEDSDVLLYFNRNDSRLPKTAGTEDIIETLVALVNDIHNLVITYELDSQSDPIEHLDKTTKGSWIDSFPFSLEDESARKLLTNLVIDSARTIKNKADAQSQDDDWFNLIQLKRTLDICLDKSTVALKAKIAGPKFLSLNGNADKITDEDIGLLFYDQEHDNVIGKWEASPIHSQDRMILRSAHNINLSKELWHSSITLQLTDSLGKRIKGLSDKQNNPINPYQNSSMSEVDAELPFLASIQRETDTSIVAQYEGSYNQSIKDDYAIIFIPDNWSYDVESNSNLQAVAKLSVNKIFGALYKLTGKAVITHGNQKYIFKTNSQDANYHYEITGRQLIDFTYPSKVLKGDIAVTAISKEDPLVRNAIPKHRIWIAPILDNKGSIGSYKTLGQYRKTPSGCYRLQVKDDDDNVLFSTTIGLIPHNFRYRLQPLKSDTSDAIGNILITNCETVELEVHSPHNLQCHALSLADNKFSLCIDRIPSEKVTLNLTFIASSKGQAIPQATTRPLRFQCYFPSSQTIIYDQHKGKLTNTLHLNIDDDLNGYRIKVFNSTRPRKAKVDFCLNSQPHKILSTTYGVDANKFLELKPVDWLPTIKRLLSLSDKGLDDEVTVILRHNSSEHFKITFGYYHYQLNVRHKAEHKDKLIQLYGKNLYSALTAQELNELETLYAQSNLQAFNFVQPEKVITLSKTDSPSSDDVEYLWSAAALEDASDGTYLIYSITNTLQESEEQYSEQGNEYFKTNNYSAPINRLIRSTVYHVSHTDTDNYRGDQAEQLLTLNQASHENTIVQPYNYDLFETLEESICSVATSTYQETSSQLALPNAKVVLTLAEASKISKSHLRLKTMRNIYRKMTFDPHHPEWNYLKTITTNCIHLPLVTLDNWVAARQVPEFMCAVIIYGTTTPILSDDIVKKVKDEIGFIWSLLNHEDFSKIYEIAKEEVKSQLRPLALNDSTLEKHLSQTLINLEKELKALSPTFDVWLNYLNSESGHTKTQVSGALSYLFGELIKQKQSFDAVWPNDSDLINTINNVIQNIDIACLLDFSLPKGYMQSTALLPIATAWLSSQPSHIHSYSNNRNQESNELNLGDNDDQTDGRLGGLKNLRKKNNGQKIAIYEIMKFAPNWYQSAFEIAFLWFSHCHHNNK